MWWVLICTVHLTVRPYHAKDAVQSKSTLYSYLNVKEFLAQNRPEIWSLNNWNRTQTNNHLVRKWTLNHLAKLAEELSYLVKRNPAVHLTVCSYHVTDLFKNASTIYNCLNVKELVPQNKYGIWSLGDWNGTWTHNHSCRERTLNHLAELPNDWALLWKLICAVHLTVCSYHVTHTPQSKSTLYNCLNFEEFLARNMHRIWSLSYCNGTPTNNRLVCKQTLKHLAKMTKWLSCAVSTYMYGAFDCMFLSCHVRVWYWIFTP